MSRDYVYGEDGRLLAWAEERLGDGMRFRDDAVAIGHEAGGRIRGVFVYDTFSPLDCMMHVASDGSRGWLTREFLIRAFAYPFVQCGFTRVSSLVDVGNAAALRFNQHLGGRIEGRLREAGPQGRDLILFGLLARECRFVKAAPGAIESASIAQDVRSPSLEEHVHGQEQQHPRPPS